MAIRWASDRFDEGIIAFVTNGSWIDGNVDAGVRACLAEEFNSIRVLHPTRQCKDVWRTTAR